jgi:LytR cell envelope-related transcriptional attenuator
MEIIQEIGSYAGFAAVLGLAVLATLYFSQARDVKRLREWAGRAPERAPAPAPPQRVVAQPIAKPAQPAGGGAMPPVPRPPGAQPAAAPAQAAAAGAGPAVAKGPVPATPAAGAPPTTTGEGGAETGSPEASEAGAGDTAAEPADVTSMDTVVHPPPAANGDLSDADRADADAPGTGDGSPADDDVAEEEGGARDHDAVPTGKRSPAAPADDEQPAEDETGEWTPEDEHSDIELTDERDVLPATPAAGRPRPPQPPRPYRRPTVPVAAGGRGVPGRGPILPPYAESRPDAEPARAGGRRRRPVVLALVAVLALAIGAFAVLQLVGGDDGGSGDPGGLSAGDPSGDGSGDGRSQEPIDPSNVTVAVLNGTTVPGLAAQIGDQVAGQGFQLGTVTNNFDQARAESVVLYAPGAEREASDVSRRLDISQREPIDADSQALAGDASVVVVAGADQTQ